jgi:hypothetical protein
MLRNPWLASLRARVFGSNRHSVRPRLRTKAARSSLNLEVLENRLAPAAGVSLGTNGALHILESAAADVTVTSLSSGALQISLHGDTFATPATAINGVSGFGTSTLTVTSPPKGLSVKSAGSVTVNAAGGSGVAVSGPVTLIGKGDAANPVGVTIDTTLNAGSCSLTLNGTGSSGTGYNHAGVLINGGTVTTSSSLSITGTGAGTGNNEDGVDLWNGAIVSDTGSGAVTIKGTAGAQGKDGNFGVCISTGSNTNLPVTSTTPTQVNAVNGNVSITGTGAGTGQWNYGIAVSSGAQVGTTGSGTLSLTGTGGNGTYHNEGVIIAGSGTTVSAARSNLSVTGTGQGSGSNNYGVTVSGGAQVETGSNRPAAMGAGMLTITGTGSTNGVNANFGVNLTDANTLVQALNSGVSITGFGNGTGSYDYGVGIQSGAMVSQSGLSNVSLYGSGSNAGSGTMNDGVYLSGSYVYTLGLSADGFGGPGSNSAGISLSGSQMTAQTAAYLYGVGGGSSGDGIDVLTSSYVGANKSVNLTGLGQGSFSGDGVAIGNSSVAGGTVTVVGSGTLVGDWISASNVTSNGQLTIAGTGSQQNSWGTSNGVTITQGAWVGGWNASEVAITGSGIHDGIEVDGAVNVPGLPPVNASSVWAPNGKVILLGDASNGQGVYTGGTVTGATVTNAALQNWSVFSAVQSDLFGGSSSTWSSTLGVLNAAANDIPAVSQAELQDLRTLVANASGLGLSSAVVNEANLDLSAANGPVYNDVVQEAGPTCWIDAAIAAVLHSGVNLGQRIQYQGNNWYTVNLYNYNDSSHTTMHAETEWVYFDGTRTPADTNLDPNHPGEAWVVILQRAVIEAFEKWDPSISITNPHSGTANDPLAILTGNSNSPWISTSDSNLTQDIINAVNAGKSVLLNTLSSGTTTLVAWHYYAVLSADSQNVTLYNPWGSTVTVPWSVILQDGIGFYVH